MFKVEAELKALSQENRVLKEKLKESSSLVKAYRQYSDRLVSDYITNPRYERVPYDKGEIFIYLEEAFETETVRSKPATARNPALETMVGGAHYQPSNDMIQPVQFYHANPQLDFQQTNIIKYAYRHKDKNGVQDLLKVIHYTLLEVGFHYPDKYEEFTSSVKDLIKK